MREEVQLCGKSKKKARGHVVSQEGDAVGAVCLFKDLDRKDLLTCREKRYQNQMKIFPIWANLTHLMRWGGGGRVRRGCVKLSVYPRFLAQSS